MVNKSLLRACCMVAATSAWSSSVTAQCDPLADFAMDWYLGEVDLGPIRALEVFNPGDGPKLYAGRAHELWEYGDGRWTLVPGFGGGGILALFAHDDLSRVDGNSGRIWSWLARRATEHVAGRVCGTVVVIVAAAPARYGERCKRQDYQN